MKKISFFGATGMLGRPVVREFIGKGHNIIALSRDIDKALNIFPEQVKWIQGDLSQNEKIDETVKGSDVVYINLSVDPSSKEKDYQPEREGITAILRSAKWNNVSRIVFMSSLVKSYEGMNGFHWWVFQMKHQAVEKIKRSGIPYIIFNPSTFMENYSEGGFVTDKKLNIVGRSKHPNWLIAGDDFAKMASKALEVIKPDESQEYVIQGPEGFLLDKAAAIFIKNHQQEKLKPAHHPISIVKALGLFNQKFDYIAKIMDAMNNYPETFQSEEVWKELGKPQTTFEEYIQSKNKKKEKVEEELKE